MSGWTVTLDHDGRTIVADLPVHIADVASMIAPLVVAMFGGPVSVGAALHQHAVDNPQPAAEVPGQLDLLGDVA